MEDRSFLLKLQDELGRKLIDELPKIEPEKKRDFVENVQRDLRAVFMALKNLPVKIDTQSDEEADRQWLEEYLEIQS
jgi:hypothetical protein